MMKNVQAMDKATIDDKTKTATTSDETLGTTTPNLNDTGVLNVKKQESQVLGTKIQDTDQLTVMSPVTGTIQTKSDNDRAPAYLNDTDWDLSKLEEKFTKVTTFDWAETNSTGDILINLTAPTNLIVTPAQEAPFTLTRLWKCSEITLKVVIKASPFYQGALVIGFSPFLDAPNFRRQINMGAMVYKISDNSSVEYTIPFRFPLGYLDITNDILGTFSITVLSPLRTGTGNPSSVSGVVYVSIKDSHFKIPEVIEPTQYFSPKFNKGKSIITIPESGPTRIDSVLVNVNDPPSQLKTTMMCAGAGTLGDVKVPHFQDHLPNLVEFLKRYIHHEGLKIAIAASSRGRFTIPINNIYDVAMAGLNDWYALWRGSVNMRIELTILESPVASDVSAKAFLRLHESAEEPFLEGIHNFSAIQPAAFTIPWVGNAFVAAGVQPLSGNLEIEVYNYNVSTVNVILNIKTALGDDFHAGLFQGAPTFPLSRKPFNVENVVVEAIPLLDITPTVAEAGVIEFIDRALQTITPVEEIVSKLGNRLDAHMITYQPYPVQERKIPYEIAADNINYTERLLNVAHNGMTLPDNQCFGVEQNETDIQNLLSNVKSLENIYEWPDTAVQGTKIAEFLLGPSHISGMAGDLINTMSTMAYKWTGSMIYIFDIIASQMHRGQLMFSFTPNAIDSIAYGNATQTYFATLEISEGRGTIAIQLPYLSQIPYRDVSPTGTPYDLTTHCGKLEMFVQNPLRSTTATSASAQIVSYVMAGPDFRLELFGNPEAVTAPSALKRYERQDRKRAIPSSSLGKGISTAQAKQK